MSAARDQLSDVLQIQIEVWRHGAIRCEAAAILNGFTALGITRTVAIDKIRLRQGEDRPQTNLCNKALRQRVSTTRPERKYF